MRELLADLAYAFIMSVAVTLGFGFAILILWWLCV